MTLDATVTHRRLVLGNQDSETGWYKKAYMPSQGCGKSWKIAKSLLHKEISKAEFIQKEISLLDEEIDYAFTLLNKPWDLFVFYTKVIDSVGHFLAWDTKSMWHLYERVDNFVKELTKRVGSNTFILVISDHGMKRTGIHSDHAFYSTNVRLNLTNPKMTDFYNIIAEKLGTNENTYAR